MRAIDRDPVAWTTFLYYISTAESQKWLPRPTPPVDNHPTNRPTYFLPQEMIHEGCRCFPPGIAALAHRSAFFLQPKMAPSS